MGELLNLDLENPHKSIQVLENVIKAIRKGEIRDFVLIASQKVDPPKPDHDFVIHNYWFGKDSCMKILGLLEYMKMKVCEYIQDNES